MGSWADLRKCKPFTQPVASVFAAERRAYATAL